LNRERGQKFFCLFLALVKGKLPMWWVKAENSGVKLISK